jgi:hypothetical protein
MIELVFGTFRSPLRHVAHRVFLAFLDVDGDVDVLLSGVMDTWVEAMSMLM